MNNFLFIYNVFYVWQEYRYIFMVTSQIYKEDIIMIRCNVVDAMTPRYKSLVHLFQSFFISQFHKNINSTKHQLKLSFVIHCLGRNVRE